MKVPRNVLRGVAVATVVASASAGLVGVASAATFQCAEGDDGMVICANTKANDNVRAAPNTSSRIVMTIPKGEPFALHCYTTGTSVSGDNIWYGGIDDDNFPQYVDDFGYVAGFNLSSGHDPAPGVQHC